MKAEEIHIILSKQAIKDLKRVPDYIAHNLEQWIDNVLEEGLDEVRKIAGYHDEPLFGDRQGQRSIRLNKSYRAIYQMDAKNTIEVIKILEVNKRDY